MKSFFMKGFYYIGSNTTTLSRKCLILLIHGDAWEVSPPCFNNVTIYVIIKYKKIFEDTNPCPVLDDVFMSGFALHYYE